VKRRQPTGDGRPAIPVELLSLSAWYDHDQPVPAEHGSPEGRSAYLDANAWGRWRDEQRRWAAGNGYTSSEMYESTQAAQGAVVDGPVVVRP